MATLQADATRDALLSVIGLKEEVLQIVAGTASTVDPWTQEALQPMLEAQWASSASFDAVLIGDDRGISLAFAPPRRADGTPTATGVDYSDRQYYRDLIRTGKTSYGPLVMGKQSRVPNIHVAVPIYRLGQPRAPEHLRGLVTGSVRTALLHQVALGSLSSTRRRILVLDDSARVVVDTQSLLPPLSDASDLALAAHPCVPRGIDLVDGTGPETRAVCSPMQLGAQKWSIWLTAPRSLIVDETTEARTTILQVALLLLLCALLLAGWTAAQSAQWVRSATRLAERIRDGELDLEVPEPRWHHPREAHTLRETLLRTLQRLKDNKDNVERLVGELTALNQQLQPYADAWAEVSDAIEILDPEGVVMFANPAFGLLTGHDDSAIGQPSPLLQPYQPSDQAVPRLLERARRGEPWREQLRVKIKGEPKVHDIHLTPVLDPTGELARIVVTRSDVTLVRNAQAAAVHNDRLAALGTMAAGLAHEINNPLTYIRMSLEMVREERQSRPDPTDMARQITRSVIDAVSGVERVTQIVQDMLGLARSGAIDNKPQPLETVAIADVVRSSMTLVRPRTKNEAVLQFECPAHPYAVLGRRSELIQLLVNLLINAVQAMEDQAPDDSRITIRLGRDTPEETWVEVEDTGPGIPVTEIERVFEPFYTSKPVGQGAGLGLAVSRGLVTGMDGRLTVTSEPGRTCFRATLRTATELPRVEPRHQPTPTTRGTRILVIDDDPRVARGIKLMLRKYDVTLVEEGLKALELLREHHFDLIICDVMMPTMDGPTVYRNLKQEDPLASKRLVFLTGAATNPNVRDALRATGRRVLSKPTNRATLEQLVQHARQNPEISLH